METITYTVSSPTYLVARKLTKEQVIGEFDDTTHRRINRGLIVAEAGEECPVFGDIVPYKSFTVVCQKKFFEDVAYWCEYVHGAHSISDIRDLGRSIAIRSDYKCW